MSNGIEMDASEMMSFVTTAMREHTAPFATRLSAVLGPDNGEHVGTGSFIQLLGKSYLLTNEHVAAVTLQRTLAYGLGEHYVLCGPSFQTLGAPYDLAVAATSEEPWHTLDHDCRAVPVVRLAHRHEPAEHELLFLTGFSGERSYFSPSLGTLFTRGTPYLTQEADVPHDYRSDATFALFYNSEHAISIDGSTRGLPTANGFSGSLVWDTKALRCYLTGEKIA